MNVTRYETPVIGTLTLVSEGGELAGCLFEKDRFAGKRETQQAVFAEDPVLARARAWLDRYFAGERPDPRELPLPRNVSPFQLLVREEMLVIPYGETRTYGDIAKALAARTGRRVAAQAVGGAVGRNPLGIIVPCHRVMGAHGNLTGFGGGLDAKVALLAHEGVAADALRWPE